MTAAWVIIPGAAAASAAVSVLAARRWLPDRSASDDDQPLGAPVAETAPQPAIGAPYLRGEWPGPLPDTRVYAREGGGPAAGMTRAGGRYTYPELVELAAADPVAEPAAPVIPAGRAELPIVAAEPAQPWTGPLPIEQAAAAAVAARVTVAQAPVAESGEAWLARTAREGQAWLSRMTAEYAPHQLDWMYSPDGRSAIRAELRALAGAPRRLAIAPPATSAAGPDRPATARPGHGRRAAASGD